MSPAFKANGTAARILADDLRKLHINTQLLRFGRLFAIYLVAHWVFPNGFNWQTLGILTATAAEAAFQQMFPQLPLVHVLHAAIASTALRRYLGGTAASSTSGAPQTVPVSAAAPLTASPAASPAAGTPLTATGDPSAAPAHKPQAVPKPPSPPAAS